MSVFPPSFVNLRFCLFLFFAGTVAPLYSQPPTPTRGDHGQEPKQQTQSNQTPAILGRGTEKSPLVVQVFQSDSDKKDAQERAAEAKKKPSDWWLIDLTWGLVIVGAGQLGLFWWQLRLIRRSLVDTRLAAKAAKKSADAAIKAADVMDDTAKRQLRAYVVLIHGNNVTGDLPNMFRLKLKNCGQTPAFEMRIAFEYRTFEGAGVEWPKSTPFPAVLRDKGSRAPLGSGIEMVSPIHLDRRSDWSDLRQRLEDSNSLRVTLYFYGQIDYRDIFNKTHFTKFCLRHIPEGPATQTAVARYHNETDDQTSDG